jgi:trehalose 6-phosphate synthase
MVRLAKSLFLLLAVLGALAWIAEIRLVRTTRDWLLRDASMRSRLAVSSARVSLASRIRFGDSAMIASVLNDLTCDERIMAIGLCDDSARPVQSTPLFPRDLTCASMVQRWKGGMESDSVWEMAFENPSGPILLSVHPLSTQRREFGWVAVVQDLSSVRRRGEETRLAVFAILGGLALAAALVTLLASHLARKGWMRAARKAVRGESVSDEYLPLLSDVRELVEDLASERSAEGRKGGWDPDRLKSVLKEQLSGERILVLANREPYIHDAGPEGVRVLHPASGLVTALEPLLRACSGTWVAHGSGSGDRAAVDSRDRVAVPPGAPSYQLRRVWLSEEEESGFYYGFSNEGLWPLCHLAHTRPHFRHEDWKQYRMVNERFAEAVCREAGKDDPVVLVQDYHFALAPRMIRDRLPKATILSFWHIPWPNAERFGICPWREEILDGMLGASILGFHTRQHCNYFMESVDSCLEARIDRESSSIVRGGKASLVRPYPISIAWPDSWAEGLPPSDECLAWARERLGLGPEVRIGVGVDRLDYTKGLEERFLAVDRLMETCPEHRERFTFVQIGAPSRSRIPQYQRLNEAVTDVAEEVNARWGTGSWKPIVLLKTHHEPAEIYRYYKAADLCYVSSLHDGMNLVAKEYVAARDDERGCLVLSRFAGAAKEMTEALVVNPYDLSEAGSALAAALRMPSSEQRDRMRSMRALVAERNVYRWAGRMLLDASRLRRQERLTERLNPVRRLVEGIAE